MFGNKKIKPLSDYPETWDIAEGIDGDNPIFIRTRSLIKEAVGHPEYPFQIGVAVPLKHPTPDGLPTNQEAHLLNDIEDKLTKVLTTSVLVMIITTSGMREFVFYEKTWRPEELEAQVKSVNKEHPDHQLQFIMKHDPNWSIIKPFLS
jgi:hypothetical protein